MEQAFRDFAKRNPQSEGAREVGQSIERAKRDKHTQFLDRLSGEWEVLGGRVFQWDYDPKSRSEPVTPFWKLEKDLSRLHTLSIGLSLDEQTGMLTHFAYGLRISEEGVDPAIRRINGTAPLPEVLANPYLVVYSLTLSPVSDLFLHHYTYLSSLGRQSGEALRGYVVDKCVREGAVGYIGLPQVLPAASEWIWRK